MPITVDSKPGSAKKHQRTRSGRIAADVAVLAPGEPDVVTATMRVRMLRSINSKIGFFREGQVADLPIMTARSWIGFGLAEQDKMLDRIPETK